MRRLDVIRMITQNVFMFNLVLWTIDNANKGGVSALTVSNNYNFICSGGETGEIRVWDFRTKTLKSHLKEHLQRITKIQLLKNNVHLISSAKDKVILIWDLNKEKRIANYQQNMGGVNNFTFSPLDENILYTVGQDKKITQWDLRIQTPASVINTYPMNNPELSDEIFGLAVSNNGRYLAAGGVSGHIKLYDMNNNWNVLTEVYAHSSTCTGLAFTYDDKHLISTGEDSQILSFNFNI
jgi:WD40 repeat protein